MTDPAVVEPFYSAVREKAMAKVKDILRSPLYPVQYPSQGDFKWNWQNANQMFNDDTYQYVNARVLPGKVPGTVALSPGGGFANAYDAVLSDIVYSLSTADLGRLSAAQSNASVQAGTVVKDYQNLYGEITSAQMTSAGVQTKQDYVISYVLGSLWSGQTPPLTYSDMAAARNLRDKLPKAPAGGDQVITDVAEYLADGRKITSSATATIFAWLQPAAARLRSAWAIAEPSGAIKKRVLRISPPGRPVVERDIVGGIVVVH